MTTADPIGVQQTGQPADASLGRFGFSCSPCIDELLKEAAQCPNVSTELRGEFERHLDHPTVPWRVVERACKVKRQQQQQQYPQQQQQSNSSNHSTERPQQPTQQQSQPLQSAAAIFTGSTLVLPSPPIRQRSEQVQQRLAKLQEQLDSQRYAAMVADVTQDEQAAAAAASDPFFPTTKLQLSFGLHVLVTMGTFFALGYYGGLFLLHSQSWAALSGCMGLVCGLLLETSLLILRMNMPAPLDKKYGHLMDKKWDNHQQQQQQQQGGSAAPGGITAKQPSRGSSQASSQSTQQLRRRRAA